MRSETSGTDTDSSTVEPVVAKAKRQSDRSRVKHREETVLEIPATPARAACRIVRLVCKNGGAFNGYKLYIGETVLTLLNFPKSKSVFGIEKAGSAFTLSPDLGDPQKFDTLDEAQDALEAALVKKVHPYLDALQEHAELFKSFFPVRSLFLDERDQADIRDGNELFCFGSFHWYQPARPQNTRGAIFFYLKDKETEEIIFWREGPRYASRTRVVSEEKKFYLYRFKKGVLSKTHLNYSEKVFETFEALEKKIVTFYQRAAPDTAIPRSLQRVLYQDCRTAAEKEACEDFKKNHKLSMHSSMSRGLPNLKLCLLQPKGVCHVQLGSCRSYADAYQILNRIADFFETKKEEEGWEKVEQVHRIRWITELKESGGLERISTEEGKEQKNKKLELRVLGQVVSLTVPEDKYEAIEHLWNEKLGCLIEPVELEVLCAALGDFWDAAHTLGVYYKTRKLNESAAECDKNILRLHVTQNLFAPHLVSVDPKVLYKINFPRNLKEYIREYNFFSKTYFYHQRTKKYRVHQNPRQNILIDPLREFLGDDFVLPLFAYLEAEAKYYYNFCVALIYDKKTGVCLCLIMVFSRICLRKKYWISLR